MLETAYLEGELIRLIRTNNKAGFDYLYANYAAALLCCIQRIIHGDCVAEKILHDSFVAIWTTINTYDPGKMSFYMWMHGIANNKATDFMHGRGHEIKSTPGKADTVNADRSGAETSRTWINKPVTVLPEDHKELICLVYHSRLSIKEFSGNSNMAESDVKTRLRRAMNALKKEFGLVV